MPRSGVRKGSLAVDGKKVCSRGDCPHNGELQSVENFTKARDHSDGLNSYCKDCDKKYRSANREKRSAQSKIWRKANLEWRKEYQRKYNKDNSERITAQKRRHLEDPVVREKVRLRGKKVRLKRKYNLTPEQYDLMMKQQDYKCGLCGGEFSYEYWRDRYYPCVHHDHDTGFIIGIWHQGCNMGEAHIKTVNQAISLAKYIQEREAITLLKAA